MADWLEILREQGEIATRMGKNVPEILSRPDLTLDQASRLYQMVERGAQDFEGIVGAMEEYDLPESAFEAAETLQAIWDKLSIAAANKVRSMQGLKPTIVAGDDE